MEAGNSATRASSPAQRTSHSAPTPNTADPHHHFGLEGHYEPRLVDDCFALAWRKAGVTRMNGQKNISVLVVEDSAIVRKCLRVLLSEADNIHSIQEAKDAVQGVALFDRARPDVVILDLHLPRGNGLDVLRHVKGVSPFCVVIVLTTYAFPDVRHTCLESGADYFLSKPTEFEKILEILASMRPFALESSEAQQGKGKPS
jgi:CheY-like chemotaxis protein